MNKLVNKFEDIFLQKDKWMKDVYKDCAEETKKIAIEFANYCNSSGDCSELFDKFIEEYYE